MDTKTRYTLTVPLIGNDGHSLSFIHRQVRKELSDNFEGFSSWEGIGYWGGEHAGSEPVVYYVIDVPDESRAISPNALWILRNLALYVKTAGAQDAVYLTRQSIDVELI